MKKMKKMIALFLAGATMAGAISAFSGCIPEYCQHTLKEIPRVNANCQQTGLKTAYECTKCEMLFAYTDEKGLYEITEQEVLPLSGHTVGTQFSYKAKEGVETIGSLGDMVPTAVCTICQEIFEVSTDNMKPFAPSDQRGKHVMSGDAIATEFTFASGTTSGSKITIEPLNDSGSMDEANVEVPFTENTSRYLVMFIYNSANFDVNIEYGAERNGERCKSPVTVPAKGYASVTVDIKFSGSDPRSWHELYMMQDLSESVTLTMCGYYYASSVLKNLSIGSKSRTEFAIGETFNAEGLSVVANYVDGTTRVLAPEEYTINLTNKVLESSDTQVIVTFKNKTVKYDITVKHFYRNVTLNGATYSDGSRTQELLQGSKLPDDIIFTPGKTFSCWVDLYGREITDYVVGDATAVLTAKYGDTIKSANYALGKPATSNEDGFDPGNFGLGRLTDGTTTGWNAWGSDRHDSASNEVYVEIDLGEVMTINEVDLFPREADGLYFPVDYVIFVSEDGVNYTNVFTVAGDAQSTLKSKLVRYCHFADVNARYVRIAASKLSAGDSGSDYYCEFAEIEIYHNA